MRTFKAFIQLDELETIKPKAKKEQEFVKSTYLAQVKDPGDLEKVGPEEEGPKDVKLGQGKRPADRLDNKQAFGEEAKTEMKTYRKMKKSMEEMSPAGKTTLKHIKNPTPAEKHAARDVKSYADRIALLRAAKARAALKEDEIVDEANLTPQQTKMAHTIGKEFEKKNVGDESKGGPYAVATAMVKDKPEAAKKAYATIKSKMKEDADAEILFKLYEDLNEDNQEMFMMKLEEDADALLNFAKEMTVE
jgi:hypothetical protein